MKDVILIVDPIVGIVIFSANCGRFCKGSKSVKRSSKEGILCV